MKKILSILILASLAVTFTACGESTEESVSESTVTIAETESTTEEETTETKKTTVTTKTEKVTEPETETETTEPETTGTETAETETTDTETTTETEAVVTEPETVPVESVTNEYGEPITEPVSTEISDFSETLSTDVTDVTEPVQPVNPSMMKFVLDMQSNCIHANAECPSAKKITKENYTEVEIYDTELQYYNNIYWACDECFPENLKPLLPKF